MKKLFVILSFLLLLGGCSAGGIVKLESLSKQDVENGTFIIGSISSDMMSINPERPLVIFDKDHGRVRIYVSDYLESRDGARIFAAKIEPGEYQYFSIHTEGSGLNGGVQYSNLRPASRLRVDEGDVLYLGRVARKCFSYSCHWYIDNYSFEDLPRFSRFYSDKKIISAFEDPDESKSIETDDKALIIASILNIDQVDSPHKYVEFVNQEMTESWLLGENVANSLHSFVSGSTQNKLFLTRNVTPGKYWYVAAYPDHRADINDWIADGEIASNGWVNLEPGKVYYIGQYTCLAFQHVCSWDVEDEYIKDISVVKDYYENFRGIEIESMVPAEIPQKTLERKKLLQGLGEFLKKSGSIN